MKKSRGVLGKLNGFLRNKAGNFGVMMGVMAFPLVGAAALAVDYSNVMRDRTMVQASLDAATLAAAKEYSAGSFAAETEDEMIDLLKAYGEDFFEANLPSGISMNDITLTASIETETKTDENGTPYEERAIGMDAILNYDTFLAKVIGHDSIIANLTSQVAVGNLSVEVALVIDNSGSMGSNSRLSRAKTTATDMVDQLHAAASFSNKTDPMKISLVPFAGMVNVGTNYSNANWMDKKGWAPTHHENLDWDTYVLPILSNTLQKRDRGNGHYTYREHKLNGQKEWKTRFSVFDIMNVDWGGCVESRPWPHNTLDTVQLINSGFNNVKNGHNNGDGLDALFVPNFAPSEPSRKYRYINGYGYWDEDNYNWNQYLYRSSYWNYLGDWRKPLDGNLAVNIWINTAYPFTLHGSEYADGVIDDNQNLRQDWIWRYQAARIDNAISVGSSMASSNAGPNFLCSTEPVTPLTTSKSTIKNAIDDMRAEGSTNVQEGIAWGWRTLSDGEPFTEGRTYDAIDNRKYLIVLTDGNNTMYPVSNPNLAAYSSWGYPKNGRIDEGLASADLPDLYKNQSINSYEMKMNVHTLQTCENVRNAGITIFAIAFDVSDGSSVKELLDACGGSAMRDGEPLMTGGEYYFDVEGNELEDAMKTIAAQISDMRIKR